MTELKNSVERSEGGSGATIEYSVYLTPTNVKSYYANNFDKGTLVEKDGIPVYFELNKVVADEKESVIIWLNTVSVIELEVSYSKGKYKYQFKFYY
ncbi:MAG: hypothetical protein HUJ25_16800 [Crocinitomicaceae bacterium]|nr:hypothetical protein [Crocinitomicaceae bacterium]